MSTPEQGIDVLNRVWPMLEDVATLEKIPHQEGRYINMYVVPKKNR